MGIESSCTDYTGDGCLVRGRVSRLEADMNAGPVMTGSELVLLEDWCQQFPSHSVGDLDFGFDGALYVTAGDGASFNYVDWGQAGNPCGDPPDEGGALRSQDIRTSGDPMTLDGTVLRIDPATGDPLPDNPLFGGSAHRRRSHHRLWTAQSISRRDSARHPRALDRRRRLEQVGGAQRRA